jgi:hypothetical protein
MAGTSELPETEIALDTLILDDSNPRFAQLYTGKSQDDIINYLLDEEDARDLIKTIVNNGSFRQDKKLWVLKQRNGKYLVKDGNRRCAAVKALQDPNKYNLSKSLMFTTLPVIIYDNENLLNEHIQGEHTSASKKDWSRIAKALEIQRLARRKASRSEMQNIDSDVAQLLRVANFYEKAVRITSDKLKELLRNSGVKGKKLIVFERMFGIANECGYTFGKADSHYALLITDEKKFKTYVKNIVNYLYDHPGITHAEVDKKEDQRNFLSLINNTSSGKAKGGTPPSRPKPPKPTSPPGKTGSVKTKPKFKRKDIPPQVNNVMAELYSLKAQKYPNSKAAMTRIVLELALKYVVEKTKYDGINAMSNSKYFNKAFPSGQGQYTNFSLLKTLFSNLIKNTGVKKTLGNFDLDRPNQAIHNYHAGIVPVDAQKWSDNLIDILEFILDDEVELLKNLDLNKL